MKNKFFLYLFLVLFLVSFASAEYLPLQPYNTLFYSMDNSSVIVDDSGNGINAVNNVAVYSSEGYFNGDYVFDGVASNLRLPNNEASFDFSNQNFTIIYWINSTVDTTEQDIIYFKDEGQASNPLILMRVLSDVNTDRFYVKGTEGYLLINDDVFIDNTWTMVTLTVGFSVGGGSSEILSIYQNDALVSTDTGNIGNLDFSSLSGNANERISIGVSTDGVNNFFSGSLDEIYIFNKSLNISEVSTMYHLTKNIYSGDEITTYFTLTAKNVIDENLNNFSAVINGSFYSTTNGTIITSINSSSGSLVDIIVSSNESGGYFNKTYSNVNVSSNYVATGLYQSVVRVYARELVSSDSVSGFNVSDDLGLSSEALGSYAVFNTLAGNRTYTINKAGYYVKSDSVVIPALSNFSSFSVDGLYTNVLNVSAKNILSNVSINNFTVYVNSLNYSYSKIGSTTNGSILFNLLEGVYNVSIVAPGFSISNLNSDLLSLDVGLLVYNSSFSLYTNNSILFHLFDSDGNVISSNTTSFELVGSSITYNFNTSNSSLYVDNLNDDTYVVTSSHTGYDDSVLFVTVGSSTTQEVDVYFSSSLTDKSFNVENTLGTVLSGVVITFFKNINGSLIVFTQGETDFSGLSVVGLDSGTTYSFSAVKDGYSTFTGTVIPSQDSYLIIMTNKVSSFTSVFSDVSYYSYVKFNISSSLAQIIYFINSVSGSLEYWGFNSSYRGTNYFYNYTSAVGGGIITNNISDVDSDIEDSLVVTYWFKSVGRSLVVWDEVYYLSGAANTNITLAGGLFDDVEALSSGSVIKGLLGAILIIFLFVVFSSVGNKNLSLIGGLTGLGLNYMFGLLPKNIILVCSVVVLIMLIADNWGGF